MNQLEKDCPLCEQVSRCLAGADSHLIAEFEHTVFVVGPHQYFHGYSLLLLKRHVRDLHDLGAGEQESLFRELMRATRALADAYRPWKMNHASYGNVVPHVHWHLIPRYESEPDRESQPWQHAEEFDHHQISPEAAREIAQRIGDRL